MKELHHSISFIAMTTFIVIASAAACIAAYFFTFQTGIGEVGLHNQFTAGIAAIIAFATGIIACAFAFPYQKKLKENDFEEEVSPTILTLIIIVFIVMIAALGFFVSYNIEDQKNGPITANDMSFVSKTHTGNFIAKEVSTAVIAPRVRIVFADENGNYIAFVITNRDYTSLVGETELEKDIKYEIEYYPNTRTLISIS